jgi:hypothetical protein
VWDHVISSPPSFWPFVPIAYLIVHRRALLAAPTLAAASDAVLSGRPHGLDVGGLLRRARLAHEATPPELAPPAPQVLMPLPPAAAYAPFTAFPAAAVAAQGAARRRVADGAAGVLERQRTLDALEVRMPALSLCTL